jgi:hypothetical protein
VKYHDGSRAGIRQQIIETVIRGFVFVEITAQHIPHNDFGLVLKGGCL